MFQQLVTAPPVVPIGPGLRVADVLGTAWSVGTVMMGVAVVVIALAAATDPARRRRGALPDRPLG